MRAAIRVVVVFCVSVLAVSGCKAADSEPKSGGKEYNLEVKAPDSLQPSASSKFTIRILPLEGYKIHPQSPCSIVFSATGGLAFEKAKMTLNDASGDKSHAPQFDNNLTSPAGFSGGEAAADLNFFICTPKWCQKRTEKISKKIKNKPPA